MGFSPLISVLVPVHNGERFLRQALDSLLAQSFRDFEVIVVDDGSTDQTGSILREYAAADPRIRVQHHERQGIIGSLNAAFALSSGEYIARMDADDIAFPDRFMRQVSFFQKQPGVGLLGGSAVVIDPGGREIGFLRFPTHDGQIRSALRHTTPFCHPATMMRRSALKSVGAYRRPFTRTGGDYDLWLRMSERCGMANLAEPVLYYRWHPDQMSAHALQPQLVEVLAARRSSELRHQGRPDPLDQAHEVCLDLLLALGMERTSVQSKLLAEIATRSTVLVSLGRHVEACQLLDESIAGFELPLINRQVLAQAEIAYARALFGQGYAGGALAWLVRAWTMHPVIVVQTAWRFLRVKWRAGTSN